MLPLKPNQAADGADPRWQDLYRIGGLASLVGVVITVLAVIAFLIWPYQPGFTSTEDVFATLQSDRLGGLFALDLLFIVGSLVSILPLLALYVALRRVNESYALIALGLGLVGIVSLIPARPIAEVALLSDRYAAATTDAAKSHYLAAGETLLALFNGTAWLVSIVFVSVSSLISCLLMLRSKIFSKATAYIGIVSNVSALGFLIPVVGMVFLFLATLGGAVFQVLIGRTLLRMGLSKPDFSLAPA